MINKVMCLLILLIITSSCNSYNIDYNRNKILKKYHNNKKFQFVIDSRILKFENIYLDKENIENVRVDKKNRKVLISQFENRELTPLSDFFNDTIDSKKITQLVIDNTLLIKESSQDILLDSKAIKSLEILIDKHNPSIHRTHNKTLIITTK